MKDTKTLKSMANAARALSIDMVAQANSGHPGLPLGFADVATVLFTEFLKFNPDDAKWPDRDRFVLSAGHGSALLYSLFYLVGYKDIKIEDIKNFRQLHSKTAGHPEYGYLEAIETTTGPLGQGVSNAVGFAIAERHLNSKFGDKLVNHKTYCMVGDGCLMEGISYEALSLAGSLNLKNLVLLWDNNEITIDGKTDITRNENMKMRFESIGFKYLEADGHDYDEIRKVLKESQKSENPVFINFKTTIGFCSPKEGTSGCHGSPLKGDDLAKTKENLGWTAEAFDIPKDILKEWRDSATINKKTYDSWKKELNSSSKKEDFENTINCKLPKDWKKKLQDFAKKAFEEKPTEATRKSSNKVLEVLTEAIPEMIGGSADLTSSVLTKTTSTSKAITKDDYSGRYVSYGVREHAMAGIMNGLALHGGIIPYAGTFFCFVDYMKPSVRLAALMKQRVIHVLTHDSIGLGEDGPTHQPVEQLASLRSMPNIYTFRPADLAETIDAYEIALESEHTPSAMIMSRQNLPYIRQDIKENLVEKGGYVYYQTNTNPDVSIIATGSEVSLAIKVKDELEKSKVSVRVISLPCFELFEKQSKYYRDFIIGGDKILKVGIEAASRFGWDRYIGENGLFFGLDNTFGLSGPAEKVYEDFGLSVENITKEILKKLGK